MHNSFKAKDYSLVDSSTFKIHVLSCKKRLASLELDHAIIKKVSSRKRIANHQILPLGTLFVQHTVTAVLAANLVATLQGNTGRALATEVDDGGAVDGHGAGETAALGIESVLGAHGRDLVGFARHGEVVGGFRGGGVAFEIVWSNPAKKCGLV
jgi:hypothetical protein